MKSVYSIFLSVLVLVATSGVAVSKHNCNSDVGLVSLLGDKECTCNGMHDEDACCDTDRAFFQVDDDYSITPVQRIEISSASVFSISIVRSTLNLGSDINRVVYANYKPPLLGKDIPVLIQSFLI